MVTIKHRKPILARKGRAKPLLIPPSQALLKIVEEKLRTRFEQGSL
jgi:hypothetical protein